MTKLNKKLIVIIIALVVLAGGGVAYFYRVAIVDYIRVLEREPVPEAVSLDEAELEVEEEQELVIKAPESAFENVNEDNLLELEDLVKKKVRKSAPIPESINLDVPFTSQAPYEDWSEPWQNACEEVAIMMVHHFYQGENYLSKEQASQEILDLVAYQEQNWGGLRDLNAEEVAQLAKEYYGYTDDNIEVIYDITMDDILQEVGLGTPVIVLNAGRLLGNPEYTQPGPVYHLLVIKGYTPSVVITNDSGTRGGHGYQYAYDVLYNAIHDYVEPDITQGRKVMIVMRPM